jgi:hypothetical protein
VSLLITGSLFPVLHTPCQKRYHCCLTWLHLASEFGYLGNICRWDGSTISTKSLFDLKTITQGSYFTRNLSGVPRRGKSRYAKFQSSNSCSWWWICAFTPYSLSELSDCSAWQLLRILPTPGYLRDRERCFNSPQPFVRVRFALILVNRSTEGNLFRYTIYKSYRVTLLYQLQNTNHHLWNHYQLKAGLRCCIDLDQGIWSCALWWYFESTCHEEWSVCFSTTTRPSMVETIWQISTEQVSIRLGCIVLTMPNSHIPDGLWHYLGVSKSKTWDKWGELQYIVSNIGTFEPASLQYAQLLTKYSGGIRKQVCQRWTTFIWTCKLQCYLCFTVLRYRVLMPIEFR